MTSLRVSLPRAVSFASAGAAPRPSRAGVRAPARSARRARAAPSPRAMASDQDGIEAMEARMKGKKSKPKEGYFDSYPTKTSDEPVGLWESDPAAWDATPGFEKAWSAWSGEPGMMYWMNKGAWFGAGLLAFLWVCFRFVGPALGLYHLN